MRKTSQDYCFIVGDDNKFIGIYLGHDWCAEHEWGIKGIKRAFGMTEPTKANAGIKNRMIKICPDSLKYVEDIRKRRKYPSEYFAILYFIEPWRSEPDNTLPYPFKSITHVKKELQWSIDYYTKRKAEGSDVEPKDPLFIAWDEDEFGIATMGEKEIGWLKELYQEFQKKNIAITHVNVHGLNPFARHSLAVLIADRMPQKALDQMYAADMEYYEREEYEEKIGMKAIIAKYGNKNGYDREKYFMACSPKWIDYDDAENREVLKKKFNTQYDIRYWINYSDDDNNAGWYTVEEIKKWLTTPKLHLVDIRKGV